MLSLPSHFLNFKNSFLLVLSFGGFLTLLKSTAGHGCMNFPNPRGSLRNLTAHIFNLVDEKAPVDYKPHFPAGSRNSHPGSGLRSQMATVYPYDWEPFTPLSPSFRWRSGVCGDLKRLQPQPHLRGGKFYYDGGRTVETYKSGSVISIGMSINAHHNGFMQLHLCDISKCPGHGKKDISEECFRKRGACIALNRSNNSNCDSGRSTRCAPIDRNYPGRWYFPCTTYAGNDVKIERYGYGVENTILYNLPRDLECENCVLQWFWSAANSCNPPGVLEYFDGPDRPRAWGTCFSQGGGSGGVTRVQKACGGRRFPEEYINCADIRITGQSQLHPVPTVIQSSAPSELVAMSSIPESIPSSTFDSSKFSPSSSSPTVINIFKPLSEAVVDHAREVGFGPVRMLLLIANGKRHSILQRYNEIDARNFHAVTIEVVVAPGETEVSFFIDGALAGDSTGPDKFYLGDKKEQNLKYNQLVEIAAVARWDTDTVLIYLRK